MNTTQDYDNDGNNIVPCPICLDTYCLSKEGGKCPDEDEFIESMSIPKIIYSTDKPPVWDALAERFNPEWEHTAVAYGDTIHAKYPLPADIEVHERTHLEQHGFTKEGAKKWWEQYLTDPQFRYEQELEAYRVQYQFLTKTIKDRNELHRRLHTIAGHLASMYGLEITQSEALKAIKNNK